MAGATSRRTCAPVPSMQSCMFALNRVASVGTLVSRHCHNASRRGHAKIIVTGTSPRHGTPFCTPWTRLRHHLNSVQTGRCSQFYGHLHINANLGMRCAANFARSKAYRNTSVSAFDSCIPPGQTFGIILLYSSDNYGANIFHRSQLTHSVSRIKHA